jgi:hypothetical protein
MKIIGSYFGMGWWWPGQKGQKPASTYAFRWTSPRIPKFRWIPGWKKSGTATLSSLERLRRWWQGLNGGLGWGCEMALSFLETERCRIMRFARRGKRRPKPGKRRNGNGNGAESACRLTPQCLHCIRQNLTTTLIPIFLGRLIPVTAPRMRGSHNLIRINAPAACTIATSKH